MDVANGSAAEEAEAHLCPPITGGKVCLGFVAADWLSHITHSHTDLWRTRIFPSLFASHFHSFAFRCSYQQDTFLFTMQLDFNFDIATWMGNLHKLYFPMTYTPFEKLLLV